MLPLLLPAAGEQAEPLVALGVGAHPDDLEIGCGGTLLRLLRPDQAAVRVHWLVLTSTPARAQEAEQAAATLLGNAAEVVQVHDFPDGYLPAHWAEVKRVIASAVRTAAPDLVFCPASGDAHQDHRLVNELVWQTARQTTILEYEIAKWEGDLVPPNLFVPLTRADVESKVDLLFASFPSQHDKPWWDADFFHSLPRLRGVEAGVSFAEAFHCRKVVLGL